LEAQVVVVDLLVVHQVAAQVVLAQHRFGTVQVV
jgi:hypothetical protein